MCPKSKVSEIEAMIKIVKEAPEKPKPVEGGFKGFAKRATM